MTSLEPAKSQSVLTERVTPAKSPRNPHRYPSYTVYIINYNSTPQIPSKYIYIHLYFFLLSLEIFRIMFGKSSEVKPKFPREVFPITEIPIAGSKHGGVTWLREYWLSSSLCRPGTHLLLIEACRIKV